jgi:hypothetical protein
VRVGLEFWHPFPSGSDLFLSPVFPVAGCNWSEFFKGSRGEGFCGTSEVDPLPVALSSPQCLCPLLRFSCF